MATKKTKKVATPVDQRETFVSIQKNFADSDISVEEKLRILYELQKVCKALAGPKLCELGLPASIALIFSFNFCFSSRFTFLSDGLPF